MFCGARRRDDFGCVLWTKIVTVKPNALTITVCPDCARKHNVEALFERVRRVNKARYVQGAIR